MTDKQGARIDEIIENCYEHDGNDDGFVLDHDKLKAALSAMVNEIIGKEESTEHKEWDCPCGAIHTMTEEFHERNKLREQQRRRAIERGFIL